MNRDRNLTLNLDDCDIDFHPIELSFSGLVATNTFSKKNNKTVSQTLEHHKYAKLKDETESCYADKLNVPLGTFLMRLKSEQNDFYLKFLNKYGDGRYEKFVISDTSNHNKKGVYIFTLADSIMYVGRCKDAMKTRINLGYGSISPKNCYIDGQSTNCRMNPLISSHQETLSLWLHALKDNNEIETLERRLISKLNPPWNIK